MGGFSGQTAVVTGASSGVGRAIATAVAGEGATVMLVGRNPERLAAAAEEAGEGAVVQRADLTSDREVRALADRVRSELGGVDILVHAAAVIEVGSVGEAALDDLDRLYQTNLRAPYRLTQELLGSLRERQGQVVFVNSSAARNSGPNAAQYAATKGGLKAVADSLRAEVNQDGVRVLSLFLGRTATPMQAAVHEAEGRPYRPDLLIQPEDVARMLLGALALSRSAEVTDIAMRPMNKLQGLVLAHPAAYELLGTLPLSP